MKEQIQKHPNSLPVYCGTELWERYGFYTVQSLLALYLTQIFNWPDKQIYSLVGTFTALTYLSPAIGGWIADHLLGQKVAVVIAGYVLMFSYLILTFFNNAHYLPISLAGIAIGTGLLKPNISSMLGNEYETTSPFRERGFTLFYMGITVGIVLGTTIPSLLSRNVSWPSAFFSAAIGMMIALVLFIVGGRYLHIKNTQKQVFSWQKNIASLLLLSVSFFIFWLILSTPYLAAFVFTIIFVLSIGYLIYAIRSEDENQAQFTLIICLLCCISILFWAFYFQMFTSLTLFIERVVNPNFLGITFPAPYYVSIESIGMLLFGLVLTRNQKKLSLCATASRTNIKFLTSMLFMFATYSFITFFCYLSIQSDNYIHPILIIPAYLSISIAELLLSPVGLSAITTLASPVRVSTMMGIFFVSLGLGGYLSGVLATYTAVINHNYSIHTLKEHYLTSFYHLSFIMFLAVIISTMLFLMIKRTIKKINIDSQII